MRLEQELACDEAGLRRRPHDRAIYARTLRKTQPRAMPTHRLVAGWLAAYNVEVPLGLLKARSLRRHGWDDTDARA